jgi:PTS system nitrogen regulatory IIA component
VTYLTLVQIAESFGEDEGTIRNWVRRDGLPCVIDGDRWMFDRAEVVAWAAARGRLAKTGFLATDRPQLGERLRLAQMLEAGGIWRDLEPAHVIEVLERVVAKLPGVGGPVHELLARRLRAADGISWAPIGHGLALPHLRAPVALGHASGIMALLFLRTSLTAVEPGPDGAPIKRLLFFVAPSPRAHLDLLGQLSGALHRGGLLQPLLEEAPDERIFAALDEIGAAPRRTPRAPGQA